MNTDQPTPREEAEMCPVCGSIGTYISSNPCNGCKPEHPAETTAKIIFGGPSSLPNIQQTTSQPEPAKDEWRASNAEFDTIEDQYISEIIVRDDTRILCLSDDKQEAEAIAKQIVEEHNGREELEDAARAHTNDPAFRQVDKLSYQLDQARSTNQRLNKRCQVAEAALPEWESIKDIGKDARARSVCHGLTRYHLEKLNEELNQARAKISKLEKYAEHKAYCVLAEHPEAHCTCGLSALLEGKERQFGKD